MNDNLGLLQIEVQSIFKLLESNTGLDAVYYLW